MILVYAVPLVAAWLAMGMIVAPKIIREAYHGQSYDFLNNVIVGQDRFPVEFYLDKWNRLFVEAHIWLVGLVILAFIIKHLASRQGFKRFVGISNSESLGAIRFVVFGILLVNALWEDLPSLSYLPLEMSKPVGVMSWLHSAVGPLVDALARNAETLAIFQWLTCAVLAAGMVGLFTRFTVPCGAACALLMGGLLRGYAHFYHLCIIEIQLAIALSFMPCGDGFSLDRIWNKAGESNLPVTNSPEVYGWCRYLCWAIIAIPYVFAGIHKLGHSGIGWCAADNLRGIAITDSLDPMHYDFGLGPAMLEMPDWLVSSMAFTAIFAEILMGLVLVLRWARYVMPVMVFCMHLGIMLFQDILFWDLMLIQVVFFNWRPLARQLNLTGVLSSGPVASLSEQPEYTIRKYQVALVCVVLTVCGLWRIGCEYYPVATNPMYSLTDVSGEVKYVRFVKHYRDGRVEIANVTDWIGALKDGRGVKHLRSAFRGNEERTRQLAESCFAVANRDSTPDTHITQLEVQQWIWNFKDGSQGPAYGRMLKSFVVSDLGEVLSQAHD